MAHLLLACALAQAAARPQGTLTVQLMFVNAAVARQQWARLAAHVATPASRVVVTDGAGKDVLAT
jgi:hypothetical protein